MKYKNLFISIFLLAIVSAAPASAQSQADLELVTDSLFFDPALELVSGGSQVEVSFRVDELSGVDASTDVELLVNDRVVTSTSLTVSADESAEGFVIWEVPSEGGSFDLTLRLVNQSPSDSNLDNDEVSRFAVDVSSLGSPVDPLRFEESGSQIEMIPIAESEISEELLVSEGGLEPLFIHLERLNWNTYRFRPSFRLGQAAQEYQWNFGDGVTSDKRIVEHTFAGPGSYPVRLEILEANGDRHTADLVASVGFFNLANWRLWVLLGLLALIIIVAAIIAGSDERVKPSSPKQKMPESAEPDEKAGEESVINTLSEESGDFDLLAEAGTETDQLADDLIFLEDLSSDTGSQEKASATPITEPTKVQVSAIKSEPAQMPKKRIMKKKAVAKKTAAKKMPKKSTKKKTTSKKKTSSKTKK